ncbi:MAG: hypothetical protein ACRYFB_08815 [Janthinobacterium lividum]
MEFLINAPLTKKQYHLVNQLSISKEQIQRIIGRDFNKSVANILGLISLLHAGFNSDQDLEDIHHYLATEANNLHLMVKKICA